ncbi:MAG: DUF3500 domain-containing protein [Gemmatimonadota bacterium]|nr:DUF3500 domain-containing protein [Gemmatimonadota bacterium]MDH3423212.1 DUF3500 domain-containing protein [Gemmatimonadota bacterium]
MRIATLAGWRRLLLFVSASALGVVGVAVAADLAPGSEHRDAAAMTAAAERFLASLEGAQRDAATFPLESDERTRFHFIPIEMFERHGLMIADLTPSQRDLAHGLLRASLSQRGYLTATQIMELEDVLLALEGGGRFARDRDEYLFSFFGTPSDSAPWAWRFEGHHLSLHFTVVDGSIVVAAPAFAGANPAEVRDGPQRGRRVLGDREDAGRALMLALDAGQRAVATIQAEAPRDIVTGAELEIDRLTPRGLGFSDMTDDQRALLLDLVSVYTGMMADGISEVRFARIADGEIRRTSFAWAGSVEAGEPHYYRVQGPTFLIEYDNTQNGANHIHSVWREFGNDFGRDLLREHHASHPHD